MGGLWYFHMIDCSGIRRGPVAPPPCASRPGSTGTLADAQITIDCVAQDLQRRLVTHAVVCGDRLLHAIKLDEYGALLHPCLVHHRRHAPRKKAASCFLSDGHRKLVFQWPLVRIVYDAAERPVAVCRIGQGAADTVDCKAKATVPQVTPVR